MIRQAHLCAALSLLLAAVATLLLYQPEGGTTPRVADAPAPSTPERIPELTPTSPWIDPHAPREAGAAVEYKPAEATRFNPIVPRHAFTAVGTGERLEDVARRVYGSTEATDRLWRANRDTLSSRASPLEPGTLLRTP